MAIAARRVVHVSCRSRWCLVAGLGIVWFMYFFSPSLSITAASRIQWSARVGANEESVRRAGRGGDAGVEGLRQDSVTGKQRKTWFHTQSPDGHDEPKPPKMSVEETAKTVQVEARLEAASKVVGVPGANMPDPLEAEFWSWRHPEYRLRPKPARKEHNEVEPAPVPDPFPLLSQNPPIRPGQLQAPLVNRPPAKHYPFDTPLLIGFTRNWPQLIQCVVGYIAAGWPPEDIYVVENTGVMYANRDGKLSLQNPFYLNHTQLNMLGINVIIAPTLLTFAQLQNFYAFTALERNWTDFFWSHEDVLVFSYEDEAIEHAKRNLGIEPAAYSLYARAVAILEYLRSPSAPKYANHFFAYDHLTLVHTDAILDVGGWDTHIPFYSTDCDMYMRLKFAGYWQGETPIGHIMDVSTVLDDVGALLRLPKIYASFARDPGVDGLLNRIPEEDINDLEAIYEAEQNDDLKQKYQAALLRIQSRVSVRQTYLDAEAQRRSQVGAQGDSFEHLFAVAERMEKSKYSGGATEDLRNTWQARQRGGKGEPFYRDPEGFEVALRLLWNFGRQVFAEKWGHRGCDFSHMGITTEDAWQLNRDWDETTEGPGWAGDAW